ncbi:MAG: Asp-tRNA(Asn)/Glu-tRNA(Gln) amidotransferase subunit GatB [Actinobacteria bacterium]|nr:Asp-tRNA(Asn)/Glu-tRNA(Gln) amidotransferase subunit GatB [Actinomycetota bacterium]
MGYEAVIGVETHVELATRSKMFCGCPNGFGAEPNSSICPVCLGLPGALPVPNARAIEATVSLGLALGAEVAPHSVFHRKNYFYADLPKNYQISQFDLPLCRGGHLDVEAEGGTRRVGLTRIHLEEDTGKSTHLGASGRIRAAEAVLLDFNRSGVPLMEVVSEPDLRSPEEARAFAAELRAVILALGISEARLEEGQMRFDANVSVRPEGGSGLGTKVEIKNMNSLRSLQRALAFEAERQTGLLSAGGEVEQETRHWDEAAGCTRAGRSKEESSDYRYFPEPDLVPVALEAALLDRLREALPELPAQRRARYAALGLDAGAARLVAEGDGYGPLLDAAVAAGADPRQGANWLTGEVTAHLRRLGITLADAPLTGAHLGELHGLVAAGRLSATAAKEVLAGVLEGEGTPAEVAARRDLIQISDETVLEAAVAEVLAAHPAEVERLRAGEQRLIGFLVGKVMQVTGGKADPRRVSEAVRRAAG